MTMGVTAKSVKYCEMLIEAESPKTPQGYREGMYENWNEHGDENERKKKSGFANESRAVKVSLTMTYQDSSIRDSGTLVIGAQDEHARCVGTLVQRRRNEIIRQ